MDRSNRLIIQQQERIEELEGLLTSMKDNLEETNKLLDDDIKFAKRYKDKIAELEEKYKSICMQSISFQDAHTEAEAKIAELTQTLKDCIKFKEDAEDKIAELEDFTSWLFDNAERIAYESLDTDLAKEKRMYDIAVAEEKSDGS